MVQQVICVEYSNANFLYSKRGGRSHTEDSKPSVVSWAVVLNEDFWVTRQQLTSFRIAHGETEACEESHPRPLAQERGISMYFHFQANSQRSALSTHGYSLGGAPLALFSPCQSCLALKPVCVSAVSCTSTERPQPHL